MGLQLLQNTEIIKQTDVLFGKSEENMGLSRIYLAVRKFRKYLLKTLVQLPKLVRKPSLF